MWGVGLGKGRLLIASVAMRHAGNLCVVRLTVERLNHIQTLKLVGYKPLVTRLIFGRTQMYSSLTNTQMRMLVS